MVQRCMGKKMILESGMFALFWKIEMRTDFCTGRDKQWACCYIVSYNDDIVNWS